VLAILSDRSDDIQIFVGFFVRPMRRLLSSIVRKRQRKTVLNPLKNVIN